MSNCLLCHSRVNTRNLIYLDRLLVQDTTLCDAINQQIQLDILSLDKPTTSQVSCRNCFNAFKSFYQFLHKVKSNSRSVKAENFVELPEDYKLKTKECMVKAEKCPTYIKCEPDVPFDTVIPELDTTHDEAEDKYDRLDDTAMDLDDIGRDDDGNVGCEQDSKISIKPNNLASQDDNSDFEWNYEDRVNEPSKHPKVNQKSQKRTRRMIPYELLQQTGSPAAVPKSSTLHRRSAFNPENFQPFPRIPDEEQAIEAKAATSYEELESLPLVPAKSSKTGYVRYLPREKVTLEMIDSGQEWIVIEGIEYKIPRRNFKGPKPNKKMKKSAGFLYSEDTTRRKHPSLDPEGEEKIKSFMEIKCYVCGSQIESFFKLKKHFKLFHPDQTAYLTCCGRNFVKRFHLLDHLEFHDKSKIHKCNICNKIYKSKACLRMHLKNYHPLSHSEALICDECGKIFHSELLLKAHLKTHIVDDTRSFECYACTEKRPFKTLLHVKNHLRARHPLNSQSLTSVCHICSGTFHNHYLRKHLETVHAQVERERVKCEICDTWVLEKTLKFHLAKHSDMGVTCDICGKFLKNSSSLSSHMNISHNTNYKFRCAYCDKGFHKMVKMKEHIAVKHTREFLFKCRVPGCGREFRAEANWKIHEKRMHPVEYDKYFKPMYKRTPEEQRVFEQRMKNGEILV